MLTILFNMANMMLTLNNEDFGSLHELQPMGQENDVALMALSVRLCQEKPYSSYCLRSHCSSSPSSRWTWDWLRYSLGHPRFIQSFYNGFNPPAHHNYLFNDVEHHLKPHHKRPGGYDFQVFADGLCVSKNPNSDTITSHRGEKESANSHELRSMPIRRSPTSTQ